MLVCRIYEHGKAEKIVYGSCNIKGYDTKGWFPINQFDFGFEFKDKASGKKSAGGTAATGTNAGARPGAPPGSSAPQKGSSDSGDELSKVSISKPVDTGTCDLMKLAMQDRKKTKGSESKLQADIHLLSFIEINKARATFPNLMVHLEGVLVRDWKVTASGDERAEESLELAYDRAAMMYVATRDGKLFMKSPARGWDQTKNEEFTWEGNWDDFTRSMEFDRNKIRND